MTEEAVSFDPTEFEILQQVAKEFAELPDARLAAVGQDEAGVKMLRKLLYVSDEAMAGVSNIYLRVVDESSPDVNHWRRSDSSVVLCLSGKTAAIVQLLCEAVLANFGSKELFYRTGYTLERLQLTIGKLPGTRQ